MSVIISAPLEDNEYCPSQQLGRAFDIISKMFYYKTTYSLAKIKNEPIDEGYNLDNIGVFNDFATEIITNISDRGLQSYLIRCLREIRKNNLKVNTVKSSYNYLQNLLTPNEPGNLLLRDLITYNNGNAFIDFASIFKSCNTYAVTSQSEIGKEISDFCQRRGAEISEAKYPFRRFS